MTENEALLQAILADPENAALRLIYADWLDEHGDAARAEFIRVQCRLAEMEPEDERRPEFRERELVLLNRHGRGWWTDIDGVRVDFRGGFVEVAKLYLQRFLQVGQSLLEAGAVRTLELSAISDFGDVIERFPGLAQLRGLRLHGLVSMNVMRALASIPFEKLRELTISAGVGSAEVELLASSNLGRNLHSLSLTKNQMGGVGLEFLASSRNFPGVRRLDLSGSGLRDSALRPLASSPHWPQLRELTLLASPGLTGESVEALAASPSHSRAPWKNIDLGGCRIGVRACKLLASAEAFSALRRLRLEDCAVSLPALTALVQGTGTCWRELHLDKNDVQDEGMRILAQAPRLAGLKHLHVNDCGCTPWGFKDLMWSSHLSGLRRLAISGKGFDERCWQILNTCPPRAHLEALAIHSVDFPESELAALGKGDKFPSLRRLRITGPLCDPGLKALTESHVIRQVVELDVSQAEVTAEGLDRLLAFSAGSRLQVLCYPPLPDAPETEAALAARFFAQDHLDGG